MQVNESNKVVRRAKKRSTSSMFSMRDYSAYELKLVDVMMEKAKGPRLKKLRTL